MARLFQLAAPASLEVKIVSIADWADEPAAFERTIREADLVHWLLRKTFPADSPLAGSGTHVVTLNHLDKGEPLSDLGYLRKARGLIVPARATRDRLVQAAWDPERVVCIPYAVDATFIEEGARRLQAERRREKGQVFRIGFFSAAEYENDRKGIDLLPAILAGVKGSGIACELVVTGLGWEAVLARPEFRGVAAVSRLVPSYFDMPSVYRTLDAYLCVSRAEGGPMPVFEALACGVPVVSTPVGMVRDHLKDGVSFREIPFDDPGAAAAALRDIHDAPERGVAMCRAAGEVIRNEVAADVYTRRLLAFYGKVMGRSPAAAGEPLSPAATARLRRRWRAWDRSYWAKECWSAGRRKQALRLAAGAFLLDPFCGGLWRVPVRMMKKMKRS